MSNLQSKVNKLSVVADKRHAQYLVDCYVASSPNLRSIVDAMFNLSKTQLAFCAEAANFDASCALVNEQVNISVSAFVDALTECDDFIMFGLSEIAYIVQMITEKG